MSKKVRSENWGGAREGAGRPATNRKQRTVYLTEKEFSVVKPIIAFVRKGEDNIIVLEKIIQDLNI